MECAGFLKSLGCEIEVLYWSEILRNFDSDMSSRLVDYMTEMGIIFTQGNALKINKID